MHTLNCADVVAVAVSVLAKQNADGTVLFVVPRLNDALTLLEGFCANTAQADKVMGTT